MSNQSPGCAVTFIICLFLSVALLLAAGWANDKAAEAEVAKGRSEAMLIRAQAESRLTAATANVINTAAVMPFVVFGGVLLLALTVIGAIAVIVIKVLDSRPKIIFAPPQLIERQILYLPAPGMARWQVWQVLSKSEIPARSQTDPSASLRTRFGNEK